MNRQCTVEVFQAQDTRKSRAHRARNIMQGTHVNKGKTYPYHSPAKALVTRLASAQARAA